jgi:hypothetical protein
MIHFSIFFDLQPVQITATNCHNLRRAHSHLF